MVVMRTYKFLLQSHKCNSNEKVRLRVQNLKGQSAPVSSKLLHPRDPGRELAAMPQQSGAPPCGAEIFIIFGVLNSNRFE